MHGREKGTGTFISIHAPPRGATCSVGFRNQQRPFISIHAPPRGATRARGNNVRLKKNFNSRPSARGDDVLVLRRRSRGISIHAPPRGATRLKRSNFNEYRDFNSRPSARGDTSDLAIATGQKVRFQFTPLREGRQHRLATILARLYFNSRPSARGDECCNSGKHGESDFNSRPSARGDPAALRCQSLHDDFNSRPSARGDGKRYAISANLLFNPYKSAWLNNSATQFVEIILVIFHRIIA